MASPCPTSSTIIVGPVLGTGPSATTTSMTRPDIAIWRHRRWSGCGHTAQITGRSAALSTVSASTHLSASTAAAGSAARRSAIPAESAHNAPAVFRTLVPSQGHSGVAPRPTTPTMRATEMSGPTMMLATGDTKETTPNVRAMSGSVAACAASVRASGAAADCSACGSAARHQCSNKRPKNTRPATAPTES